MKIRTPYYYKDFRCIDKECTDTCCAGWEVDVDEDSHAYYDKVTGDFGDRIQSVMYSDGENHGFTLQEKKRCPFLNKENLCDLYIALGEEHLCETCAEFPRFKAEFGMLKEVGIALSCKTAGELILGSKQKVTFVEEEDTNQFPSFNEIEYELYVQMMSARDVAYDIAQNRDFSIAMRMKFLLSFAKELQTHVDTEQYEKLEYVCVQYQNKDFLEQQIEKLEAHSESMEERKQYFHEIMEEYQHLEVINADWTRMVDAIFDKVLKPLSASEQEQNRNEFQKAYKDKQYEFEHLFVYFIYRYFMHVVFDYDVLSKMKMAAVSYLVIQEMDLVWWMEHEKIPDLTAQVDLMHLYSRELEHSDENFKKLTNLFAKDSRFTTEKLTSLL